jgi:hypothetical protein
MYNLHYVPTTLGVKVEDKLYLGVREQKRLNTTGLEQLSNYQLSGSPCPMELGKMYL